MPRILRTAQVDSDLAEIWQYIAADNRVAANELIGKIDEMFELLAESPELGMPQFDFRTGLRCKIVAKRYLIFYEPCDDGIVRHPSSAWNS